MPTEEEVEKLCMKDYRQHEGKVIQARTVFGTVNHDFERFELKDPVTLLISRGQKAESIISWNEGGWCDPYWDVELIFPHSELDEASSLCVDGIGRCIDGTIDGQTGWKLHPHPPTLPAVLVTPDTEARDAAVDGVLNPDKKSHPRPATIVCPHCKAEIYLQAHKNDASEKKTT